MSNYIVSQNKNHCQINIMERERKGSNGEITIGNTMDINTIIEEIIISKKSL